MQQGIRLMQQDNEVQSHSLKEGEQSGMPVVSFVAYNIIHKEKHCYVVIPKDLAQFVVILEGLISQSLGVRSIDNLDTDLG